MPYKKSYSKKNKKSSMPRGCGNTMTTYKKRRRDNTVPYRGDKLTNRSHMPPFPSVYQTKLRMGYQCALSGASSSGIFTVSGNCLFQPFTTAAGYYITGTNNAATVTSTGACAIANEFPGYSALSSMYEAYRIIASKLKIVPMCTNSTDTLTVSMYPMPDYSATSIPIAFQDVLGNRKAKYRLVNYTSNGDATEMSTYATSMEVLGMSRSQYMDQLPQKCNTAYASYPPAFAWQWVVQWATIGGGNLGANLDFTVELEVYVEFIEPIIQNG